MIGGTGLQSLPGFTPVASLNPTTPWGTPSSPITVLHHSSADGKPIPVAFLSRHGLHHEIAPHEVPARANIAALRSLGVRTIIAFSAVGSLQEAIKPRDFVIPDDVKMLALPVLRHRVILSASAEIEGLSADRVVGEILSRTAAPR